MGKIFAALIILFTFIKLAPMCARLPNDLSAVSSVPLAPSSSLVSVATAAYVASVSAGAVAPAPAPAPAPKAEPKPEAKASPKAADDKGVIVVAYRLKKMFQITDGRGRVSVLLRNDSDRKAVDLRLTMNAVRPNAAPETDKTNLPFEIEAGTGAYRGLYATAGFLDAVLAVPPEKGADLSWSLTYRLEGDAPETKRCFGLHALPRTREPEGIVWTQLASTTACPK